MAKWMDGGGCRQGRGLAWVAQGGFFFSFFREGRNLIEGHSCINRGIEEFCVGLMELTLHEWPPLSLPPEMGHFPHVSKNVTTSLKPRAGSGRPARGKLRSFSRAVKFCFPPATIPPSASASPSASSTLCPLPPSLRPSWLKTSSKPRCLTCQKQPPSSGKSQKQNKPTTAGRVRGQPLLVH